ncbi:MAG: hypothetical protein BWX47_01970 [candidate division Hyd24-12 bacterium ADurb.Bin004]|nr:MAG: hypothetical protein BWX47_01970 [candidate division Hyd24-12 bacterium ADurb.Bin004]
MFCRRREPAAQSCSGRAGVIGSKGATPALVELSDGPLLRIPSADKDIPAHSAEIADDRREAAFEPDACDTGRKTPLRRADARRPAEPARPQALRQAGRYDVLEPVVHELRPAREDSSGTPRGEAEGEALHPDMQRHRSPRTRLQGRRFPRRGDSARLHFRGDGPRPRVAAHQTRVLRHPRIGLHPRSILRRGADNGQNDRHSGGPCVREPLRSPLDSGNSRASRARRGI